MMNRSEQWQRDGILHLDRIRPPSGNCISLSCIGVTKHAGKTTTLNACITEAEQLGIKIGLASIGVDGEKYDAITGVPKPEIYVPAGTLVATATKAVESGTAGLRWLTDTGISSPLGNVFLCQVERAGTVLLAGIRQIEHLRQIQKLMKEWSGQLELILIDGAFDRISPAHIDVCDYVLLATGAVVAHSIQGIVEKTYQVVWKLQIPIVQDSFIKQVMQECMIHAKNVAVTQDRHLHRIQASAFDPAFRLPDNTAVVCLTGAVTDIFVEQILLSRNKGLQLCLTDPTKVFTTYNTWRLAERLGHELYVYSRPKLLAITVNPYDVRGRTVAKQELQAAIQTVAGGTPVINVRDGIS